MGHIDDVYDGLDALVAMDGVDAQRIGIMCNGRLHALGSPRIDQTDLRYWARRMQQQRVPTRSRTRGSLPECGASRALTSSSS